MVVSKLHQLGESRLEETSIVVKIATSTSVLLDGILLPHRPGRWHTDPSDNGMRHLRLGLGGSRFPMT